MNQTGQDALMRKPREVRARFAQPQTTNPNVPDLKFAIDEMVQRYAAR
jgi:hypothetical protein